MLICLNYVVPSGGYISSNVRVGTIANWHITDRKVRLGTSIAVTLLADWFRARFMPQNVLLEQLLKPFALCVMAIGIAVSSQKN